MYIHGISTYVHSIHVWICCINPRPRDCYEYQYQHNRFDITDLLIYLLVLSYYAASEKTESGGTHMPTTNGHDADTDDEYGDEDRERDFSANGPNVSSLHTVRSYMCTCIRVHVCTCCI